MQVELLIIDPQVDFCDPAGALYVTGADGDITRLARMVRRLAPKLDDIHVTLDSHHFVDVAHSDFLERQQRPASSAVYNHQRRGRRRQGAGRRRSPACTGGL